ncbi:hypothetical protein HK101_002005 [Irineochytrium annulatum]|nr:hypothetical protein HK101_002005 [Irineochytrium annulatum]
MVKELTTLKIKGMRVADYLYCIGMVGVGIQVFRSESSNVNPWNLVVTHVSHQWIDTASSLCFLHGGHTWKDESGLVVQDVMVLHDPSSTIPAKYMKTSIHKINLSITFTRNPDLYIPAQQIALLSISFVKAVEQLYYDKDNFGPTHADRRRSLIEIIFSTALTIRRLAGRDRSWVDVLDKLARPHPGKYLTEAEGDEIPSIAKILVALTCIGRLGGGKDTAEAVRRSDALWADTAGLREAALAVLAESVSRGVRVMVRVLDPTKRPDSHRPLIRTALGIDPDAEEQLAQAVGGDAVAPGAFDLGKGKRHSGKFFKDPRWRTNASPWAVAACFSLATFCGSFFASGKSVEGVLDEGGAAASELYDALDRAAEEDGGMPGFLLKYGGGGAGAREDGAAAVMKKDLLQTALYVQGLRHHTSALRRAGLPTLSRPREAIERIASEERALLAADRAASAAKAGKEMDRAELRRVRRERFMAQRREFLHAHTGLPDTFSAAEVQRMNEGRATSDRIELMPFSGLPRHHCSFRGCADYMVSLATESDRVLGRRSGLYHHLRWFWLPVSDGTYFPSIHLSLCGYLQKHDGASEADLVRFAESKYAVQQRERIKGYDGKELVNVAKEIYSQYHRNAESMKEAHEPR